MSDIDALRDQLRQRGYLNHGIERWFALDPWSSRAFWRELVTVSGKAAVLVALFATLPVVAVMLVRNHPVTPLEVLGMFVVYGLCAAAVAFVFMLLVALVLKVRPELAVDTPRALLAISIASSALLTAPIALWWARFDAPPSTLELASGLLLIVLFFLVAATVISAALLSFSIYELQRIPAISQRPRGVPMALAAGVLIAALFLPAYAAQERRTAEPMIVTTPTTRRVALVAVDGLTMEIFRSRPELVRSFRFLSPLPPTDGRSAAERWASIGTGVPPAIHGVRAIEGVRFRGGSHVIQTISRADVALTRVAPLTGLAGRRPLPPTVRKRDYVWEVFGQRGLTSTAVNWWTSDEGSAGALQSIAQDSVFAAARGKAIAVDETARQRLFSALASHDAQFVTIYLPALDVILNRLPLDESSRLAMSIQALDGVAATIATLRARGYDVLLTGLPGDQQRGQAVIASTVALQPAASAYDVAPTLCDLAGFPLSAEMPGQSLASSATATESRVASYGPRDAVTTATPLNDDYYRNLRSLGYIQ